jgi:hypothetical protein
MIDHERPKAMMKWTFRMAHSSLIALFCSGPMLLVDSFTRDPCTRAVSSQFQFPDCYLPDLNQDLLLSQASFLMSHDSGTGYINPKSSFHWLYSKNQIGTAYDQLQSGARALDVRPKLLKNGTLVLQHGLVELHTPLATLVKDALQWCDDNPDELVLLLTNDLQYASANDDDTYYYFSSNGTNDDSSDYSNSAVKALSALYQSLGVPYHACEDVSGLTVGEVMQLSRLSGGGHILALDRHDNYASFCGKSNWVQSKLITCYPQNSSQNCLQRGAEPLTSLRQYMLDSANNPATDDSSMLGPPSDLEHYPFNEIQALWQVDVHSAISGLKHFSSILHDNEASDLNKAVARMIYYEQFHSISLLALDNVNFLGNAVFSLLRTQCTQSSITPCGHDLPPPKMLRIYMSECVYWSIVAFVAFVLARGIWRSHGHDILVYWKSMYML